MLDRSTASKACRLPARAFTNLRISTKIVAVALVISSIFAAIAVVGVREHVRDQGRVPDVAHARQRRGRTLPGDNGNADPTWQADAPQTREPDTSLGHGGRDSSAS